MLAILLAGGVGTRLKPLTDTIPKPLIPIDHRNLTEHVFEILKKHGINDVILSLGHMHQKIQAYFKKNNNHNMNIECLIEEKPMGTAGPLLLMKKQGLEPDDDFFMMNVDNLFSLDMHTFFDFHTSHDGVATIALHEVKDPSSYGVVELMGHRIIRFVEKPKIQEAPSHLINSGYYVISPEIFHFLDDKNFSMMERDVFPKLAGLGLLYGHQASGQWFDTGTPERYEKVKREWKGV